MQLSLSCPLIIARLSRRGVHFSEGVPTFRIRKFTVKRRVEDIFDISFQKTACLTFEKRDSVHREVTYNMG